VLSIERAAQIPRIFHSFQKQVSITEFNNRLIKTMVFKTTTFEKSSQLDDKGKKNLARGRMQRS
jgi:hypothetical protein